MGKIQVKAVSGELTTISSDELHFFNSKLILKEDPRYDEARQLWNAMIDRHPAFILQCTTSNDVMQAVRFAHQHSLLISIRGAGHNIAGRALEDDVLLIDLSQMRKVVVDPKQKTVTAEAGATLGDVDEETQKYELALPVGINSTTGIAGLTLGGGFGWLSRKYGMTVDHLLSVELVTVEGELLTVTKESEPELFWALTGGGGNFGIVTSFTFSLSPLKNEVMSGPVIFEIDEAESVLKNYRDFCKSAPNELTVWSVMRHAPPFPFLDEKYHGKKVLILVGLYTGEMDEGKELLSGLETLGTPIGNGVAPHRFTDFQKAFDGLLTPGARNYWKSHNFIDVPDALIKVLVNAAKNLPTPHSEVFLAQMGGETNRIPKQSTAYPHRDVNFIMNVHARWETPEQDSLCIDWSRKLFKDAAPFATGGVYLNFVSEGDDDTDSTFSKNFERLAKVKAKYDPKNILRSNLNITPSH